MTSIYQILLQYAKDNNVILILTFLLFLQTVDLVINGSKVNVTDDNKLYYLNCLAQHKLVSGVKEEVESFLKGLNAIIPDNLLSIFDENELEVSF